MRNIRLTWHCGHEVALSNLSADAIKHFGIVANVIDLGVILNVSDIDSTAARLSVVDGSSIPLEAAVSLRANGQDIGRIEGGDIVAVDDVDTHVKHNVGGVQLEELGASGDGVVVQLSSEINDSSSRRSIGLASDWDVYLGVDSHNMHGVLSHLLAELHGAINREAIVQELCKQLEVTEIASGRYRTWQNGRSLEQLD